VLGLAALGCACGVALGNWQAGRAEQKQALAASVKRAEVKGIFVAKHTVFLDNKQRRRRSGYEVVMPLRLSGTDTHVLVNRGWVAAGPTRDVLPEIRTPMAEVRIEGVVHPRFPRIYELDGNSKGLVRQTVDLGSFAAETGLQLRPFVIEQHSPLDDGLVREWTRPDAGVQKHQSYALQWYSLGFLAAVLGLVFSIRRVAPA
jgi:surfeit locus 1 family protein